MDYPTLDRLEWDFSTSLGKIVELYNKAIKLTNRGYKFNIYPYRFLWGDGIIFPGGRIQIAKKGLIGTYKAIEDIAASLISQLKTLDSTIPKPKLEEKINNFSKEFDNIINEIEG